MLRGDFAFAGAAKGSAASPADLAARMAQHKRTAGAFVGTGAAAMEAAPTVSAATKEE